MRAVVTRTDRQQPNVAVVEVEAPAPGPGQVQVQVVAAGVNPVDVFTSNPVAVRSVVPELPLRVGLGWELAGTVTAVGAGVTLPVGTRVVGLDDRFTPELGAQAELAVLDAGAVTPVPDDTDPVAAATLPLNAVTALQALRTAGVTAGSTVLVTGAAGAVGGYAVELAAAAGARVVGIARAGDEELVRRFGASGFVAAGDDLVARIARELPSGADAVVDGAQLAQEVAPALAPGGTFVALTGAVPTIDGARVERLFVRADADDLARVVADWRAGRLTVRVADTYPLDKVDEAHRRLAAGGLRGRLVLEV